MSCAYLFGEDEQRRRRAAARRRGQCHQQAHARPPIIAVQSPMCIPKLRLRRKLTTPVPDLIAV